MRTLVALSLVPLAISAACHTESPASPDVPSAPTALADATEESWDAEAPGVSDTRTPDDSMDIPVLSLEGLGPVKLGMTHAEIVWAKLDPKSIDGGVEVGPYRVGFAPAKGGPITSVHVELGNLPHGLRVGDKVLENGTTSLQALADAIGSCEPIEPTIGAGGTTCHDGRIVISGAGPVGGILRITVKSA